MKKKSVKNKKGITLIALVVSIVVMLILAGVSIEMTTSIIQQSKKSTFLNEVETLEESLNMYYASAHLKKISYSVSELNWDGINNPTGTAKENNPDEEDSIELILGKIPNSLRNHIKIINGIIEYFGFDGYQLEILESRNPSSDKENDIIYKLPSGNLNVGGMNTTVDENGIITLNGTLKSGTYFVKLVNEFECATSGTIFEEWYKNYNEEIAAKNEDIQVEMEIISGTYKVNNKTTSDAINIAMRTSNNEATLVCKVLENELFSRTIVTNPLKMPYLYMRASSNNNVICDNLKLKVTYKKMNAQSKELQEVLMPENKMCDAISCTINEDKSITLNGTASDKMYIKVSQGIDYQKGGYSSECIWSSLGDNIANQGTNVRLKIKKLNGEFTLNKSSDQVNVVMRNINNETAVNAMLVTAKFDENNEYTTASVKMTCASRVLYVYCSPGTTFDNYTFIPTLIVE